ncbi:MAG: transcription antitermination protein NusB, partial [Clostridia bacterium]|nr:transcription antitermination protein NusB [Clostridia bacterium]
KTERMSRVSRAILRLAVYELAFAVDIPSRVTINEAVELAKKYDDEKAKAFINGILNAVKNEVGEKQ